MEEEAPEPAVADEPATAATEGADDQASASVAQETSAYASDAGEPSEPCSSLSLHQASLPDTQA